MDLTIGQISIVTGAIVTIIGFCGLCYKGLTNIIKQSFSKEFSEINKEFAEIKASIMSLRNWNNRQQQDIDTGFEEKRLMFSGIHACLKGMHEQGCNGPVTRAIEEFDEFLLNHAHEGVSTRDKE